MNKQILHIAIPSIISNITVPLCAMVDTIIVGHLGDAAYIGAIAVGGLLFNMTYWLFSFLRMGTGGLTAQAYGANNTVSAQNILLRSLIVALSVSSLLLLFQSAILHIAFHFIDATIDVQTNASFYFNILIWGAPAVLCLYSFIGWFLGMQNARIPMVIAIVQNIVNIIASSILVFCMHLKVEGVAMGTLIAQYTGLLLALTIGCYKYHWHKTIIVWKNIFRKTDFMQFFKVNRDIFSRTLYIILVTTYFTSFGSSQGEGILATNTLLMQFFIIFSYFMDGFAYAGEAISGKCYGEKNVKQFSKLTSRLFIWGIGIATLFTLLYSMFGKTFLHILTNEQSVIAQASHYLFFVCLIPIVSFSAFLFDGLFIGTTSTREMLNSMRIASLTFFAIILIFNKGNCILWTAFLTYLGMRGVMQFLLFKSIKKKFNI